MSDPSYINTSAGSPTLTAKEARLNQGATMSGAGSGHRLGVRAGVRPTLLDAVTVAGTTITVNATHCVVYPGLTTSSGGYEGVLDAATYPITRDATNPRINIVIMRVYDDDEDGSLQRTLTTEHIEGAPAGSPTEPATPTGATKLASFAVPSVANGGPVVRTYTAPWLCAVGGILGVPTVDDLPSAGVYVGMYCDVRSNPTLGGGAGVDHPMLYRYNGTTWVAVAGPVTEATSTGWVNATGFNFSGFDPYRIGPMVVGAAAITRTGANLAIPSDGNISPDLTIGTLPPGYWPEKSTYTNWGNGTVAGECRVGTDGVVVLREGTPSGVITQNSIIRIQLNYVSL